MKAVRISLGGPEMQGYENTSRLALMIFYKTLPRPSLPTARLSKDFASAALSTLAEMMEPKGALGTLVKFGLAVDGSWAQIYHERVPLSLDQTTVAASTNADRNVLQLLNTQFANLASWESVVIAERQDLNGTQERGSGLITE